MVRVFNKENDVVEEFEKDNQKLYESAWKSQFFSGMMMPIMQFIGNLGYVVVAILGGFLTIKKRLKWEIFSLSFNMSEVLHSRSSRLHRLQICCR